MARTTAPLFSLDASGSLANAVVFSKWRGRQYVRRHTIPKNPRTGAQVGIRTAMKFLGSIWKIIDPAEQATWAVPALLTNISPFNAYIAANIRSWREGRGISSSYPLVVSSTAVTITQGLTGGQRNVLLTLTPSADDSNWAIAVYRSPAVIVTPNWNICVALVVANAATAVKYTDAPLPVGTYHYRSASVNAFCAIGTACADASVSVT